MSPTCVTITKDETHIYSCGKDSKIIQYDIEAGKKFVINGKHKSEKSPSHHYGSVLAVAVSSNGKYLASGGFDTTLKIWDCRTHDLIQTFNGHRDVITSLQFHPYNNTLFSGSNDRTLKVWNIDDLLCIDTLFGHQSPINSMGMVHLGGNEYNPVTASDDMTCRYWKITEETQLVFRNQHTASIDSVCSGPQKNTFVSSSQDGSLSLWNIQKKNPLSVFKSAHGGSWISSCTLFHQSDLLFSGANNGKLNMYQCDNGIKLINTIPINGHINHIAVAPRSKILVAAVGCEHKFGRWFFDKSISNRIDIIKL
eukprot:gnl/Spiro4/5130_TR2574_c0_g1_i1.p1 gnl/Spiro4/5130_TR2574_c0_g1~~gnl/Spiro4/5130_TR2574_c0_g1_i1.p1  ORF type:complete len:320 (+),score=-19.95 gnl/Spiro4/5130_TR2574_c0_g1_i1:32-961(+)